jgi:hypothetical protein
MPGKDTDAKTNGAQRVIIVELLARTTTRAELYAVVRNATPSDVDAALDVLIDAGAVQQDDGALSTTAVVRFLDSLGLVCI